MTFLLLLFYLFLPTFSTLQGSTPNNKGRRGTSNPPSTLVPLNLSNDDKLAGRRVRSLAPASVSTARSRSSRYAETPSPRTISSQLSSNSAASSGSTSAQKRFSRSQPHQSGPPPPWRVQSKVHVNEEAKEPPEELPEIALKAKAAMGLLPSGCSEEESWKQFKAGVKDMFHSAQHSPYSRYMDYSMEQYKAKKLADSTQASSVPTSSDYFSPLASHNLFTVQEDDGASARASPDYRGHHFLRDLRGKRAEREYEPGKPYLLDLPPTPERLSPEPRSAELEATPPSQPRSKSSGFRRGVGR